MKKTRKSVLTALLMSASLAPSGIVAQAADEGDMVCVYGPAPAAAGDVNMDGKVSIADAVMLSRYVNEDAVGISSWALSSADINEDGVYDMNDVTRILLKIARLDAIRGDLNHSGSLDMNDFQEMLIQHLQSADASFYNDINDDGVLDAQDVLIFQMMLLDMGYSTSETEALMLEYGFDPDTTTVTVSSYQTKYGPVAVRYKPTTKTVSFKPQDQDKE